VLSSIVLIGRRKDHRENVRIERKFIPLKFAENDGGRRVQQILLDGLSRSKLRKKGNGGVEIKESDGDTFKTNCALIPKE
jgi:hypothetical protein